MRHRQALGVALGLGGVGLGVVALVAPDALGLPTTLPVDPQVVAAGVGVVFGGYGLWASRSAGRTTPLGEAAERERRASSAPTDAFDALDARPPEEATDDGTRVVGHEFDEALRTARRRGTTDGGGRARSADGSVERVRSQVRTAAIAAVAADGDREAAVDAVDAGTWTDDPVAAAFVGDDDYPLGERLRAWLDPEAALDRRVDRAVGAVRDRLTEGAWS